MTHTILNFSKKQVFDLELKYPLLNALGKVHVGKFSTSKNWYNEEKIWKHIFAHHPRFITDEFLDDFPEILKFFTK